jgi:outer membrane protein OmpA-like peptidoglycan-associated protein
MAMKKEIGLALWVSAALLLAGCDKKSDTGTPNAVLVPAIQSAPAAPVVAPAAPAVPATAASIAPPQVAAPAASTDPDAPTPLPALQLKGVGIKKSVSYYYALNAGAGPVKMIATGKNAPSGMTQALQVALYDAMSQRLCFDSLGNTTNDKTVTVNCNVERAGPYILRLDLGEETIDYSVVLEGPVDLPPAVAPNAAAIIAGAGSTDIDAPTRLTTNRIKGDGIKKPVSYYYAFNAGPGELTLTGDGKNTSAPMAEALAVSLYNLRSERLCDLHLGNTLLDKRAVVGCKVDQRQPVVLRVALAAESVDFRVKFEGPHDFEPFTLPKDVTIALDSALLFDTGKSELKPEARKTLQEAAERVKKFKHAAITISGHTDNVGNEASNKALSEKRAESVRAWFVNTEGVPAAGLSAKGFGKSQPVADNGNEQGRARNRRVDVVIMPAKP